ncbi:DUF6297 family protein [Actinoplanes rectilineatus]|uniref:DUF6297 family protein n=1 Tax=Actinoplanes rectilineatus TaxID=113571 RepID=UPI0005F2CD79|nr:DUF6297 family protein [Actinoplanes rectilineatus]
MTTVVPLREVRSWIRRTQSAHRDRGETLSTIYVIVLSLAVAAAMFHERLSALFSPVAAGMSEYGAVAGAVLSFALLFLGMRRAGPVTLSRPAAYFLLTAPISRRSLLLPSLSTGTIGAGLVGAAIAAALLGNAAPDSLDRSVSVTLTVAGLLAGAALSLVAAIVQASSGNGRAADRVVTVAAAGGLAALVAEAAGWTPPTPAGWPRTSVVVPAAGALAVAVVVLLLLGVRRAAQTPNDRLLEAAATTGTLFDTAYAMEPSFLSDMLTRRYWSTRRLRSAHLSRWVSPSGGSPVTGRRSFSRLVPRLPVLAAQDLLLARRRVPHLLRLAAATTVPLLVARGPHWSLAAALLIGTLIAARTTSATVRTDAANPVLLRMLSLTSRQAVTQRLLVPAALGTLWATTALIWLSLAGTLPPGPWPLLGPALGAAAAVAAMRHGRAGFVRNDMLSLDTPMGALSPGPILNAVAGPDLMLLLALPALILIGSGLPPTPAAALLHTTAAIAGAFVYLSLTTAPTRTELSRR